MKKLLITSVAALIAAVSVAVSEDSIILEGEKYVFELGSDAKPKSLKLKANGEELLDNHEGLALCTVTQERPFNNEIKLAHPNKRITCRANRVKREGDKLVFGFELAEYEAVVSVKVAGGYLGFRFEEFRVQRELMYGGLRMDLPPAVEFRLAQLPAKTRANVGDWLNIVWDDKGAVALVGIDPKTVIDQESRYGFELLKADLRKDLKLQNCGAAIVVGAGQNDFLSSMDGFEADYDLPRGVKSRANPLLKHSIYWTSEANPDNIDSCLALAKQGGFRLMLMYFPCFDKAVGYRGLGDYILNGHYPNGLADVKAMLDKIHAAGIHPGFHTLQTHIGSESSYVTPFADPRLNLTRRFTLAKPIAKEGAVDEIAVLENPQTAPMYSDVRVLKFGGELFKYESYTIEPPYKFTGVKRGYWVTDPLAHAYGEIGGILDVSEYGATSCYIDQNTDLQDEVGRKIAAIYDCGMDFFYFDGSEGVNPPCGVNVSLGQLRVTSKCKRPIIYTEGAAKSHFGWHLQAGANAFDVFPPEIFKKMIVRFPQAEAPLMRKNLTRLDFGWWGFYLPGQEVRLTDRVPYEKMKSVGTQYDMWEFGTSRAAAWDCPATVMIHPEQVKKHPRGNDLMEMMRRWEDVRENGFLTAERKEALKSSTQEHHLYLNKNGEYELFEIKMLTGDEPGLRAFLFERKGKRVIAYWHTCDKGEFKLPLGDNGAEVTLVAENLKYFETELSESQIRAALKR